MIEKIIVVAPTTAVPMSTGFAVALNVLPAPSFSSRKCFAFSNSTSKPKSFLISAFDVRDGLDERELVDALRVVGDRAVRVDGDRDRAHAEEAERDETEREDRRRVDAADRHRCWPTPVRRLTMYAAPIRHDDDDAHPEGAEVAGGETGEDVERRAAFPRRRDDLAHVRATRST